MKHISILDIYIGISIKKTSDNSMTENTYDNHDIYKGTMSTPIILALIM